MLGLGLGIHRTINFSSRPFTPTDIDTALWLDASRADTIIENGGVPGNVAQWNDLSGNNNHALQGVEADQSTTGVNTLNSLNVLKFTGDFMSFASEITGIKSAIFVTNNLNGSDSSIQVSPILGQENVSPNAHTFVRVNTTDLDYDISIDGDGTYSGNASVNGGALFAGKNINLGQTDAENMAENIWYADYDTSISVKHIGRLYSGGIFETIGDIAEIILLDYIPTTEDRQKIEVYLQAKWNTPALP